MVPQALWYPLDFVLVLYCFVFAFFVVALTAYHVYLVMTGQTTHEQLRKTFPMGNPHHKGCVRNCILLFCTPPLERHLNPKDADQPLVVPQSLPIHFVSAREMTQIMEERAKSKRAPPGDASGRSPSARSASQATPSSSPSLQGASAPAAPAATSYQPLPANPSPQCAPDAAPRDQDFMFDASVSQQSRPSRSLSQQASVQVQPATPNTARVTPAPLTPTGASGASKETPLVSSPTPKSASKAAIKPNDSDSTIVLHQSVETRAAKETPS
eukprot:g46189.t1